MLIAIDPDLHKTGIAVYENGKFIYINSNFIWDIFGMLKTLNNRNDLTVLIEFPKNTNTYHNGGKGAALNVGKNQAVAIILKEFCEQKGINFDLLPPAGYSKLFANEDYFKKQTGWSGRTNKDARSAAAMIFLNKKKYENTNIC